MPYLLSVVLIPPLLIFSTLLLAHVEKRVTALRQRPAPLSPDAPLTPTADPNAEQSAS